ncbi:hypothetical protein SO694_00020360 [Aureococcus anophagefferens]|uniref:Nickel/cobalt efflux system n=1 Tax=Aureococcus anophagefferens TaxID=44056 RepID=A0ABR1FU28_AURAN
MQCAASGLCSSISSSTPLTSSRAAMTDLRWDESLTQVALVGTGMGVAHVLSPDHLSALATLSANGGAGAFRLGVRWGVGHSTGMLGMACALLAVTWGGERAAADRGGGGAAGALRARPLDGGARDRDDDDDDRKRHHHHHHHHGCEGGDRGALALCVGVVHGLTHVVWVLPVLELPTAAAAAAYLGAFSATSTVVMGGFAAAWGGATRRYAASSAELTFRLAAASSGLSVAVGLLWLGLLATGGLDGAVLGHDHGHGAHGHG